MSHCVHTFSGPGLAIFERSFKGTESRPGRYSGWLPLALILPSGNSRSGTEWAARPECQKVEGLTPNTCTLSQAKPQIACTALSSPGERVLNQDSLWQSMVLRLSAVTRARHSTAVLFRIYSSEATTRHPASLGTPLD
jgi:hypothetical protein